jgi:hypothetical protein
MINNPEPSRPHVDVIDYWTIKGAPYSDTAERMNQCTSPQDRDLINTVNRLGELMVTNQGENNIAFRSEHVTPIPQYRQYGFETAGHGLWFALDHRVKEVSEGAVFLGEVQQPELFEKTETPRPLLVAVYGEAAREDPEEFPDYAFAISKIEDPQAKIPVYLKFRI